MRATRFRRKLPSSSTHSHDRSAVSPVDFQSPFSAPGAGRFLAAALALSCACLLACVEQDEDKPSTDDMKAAKQNILTAAPAMRFPANADLDGKIVYLGLDIDTPTIEPGKDVKVTHYWKVVAAPGDGWRVFTHINGPTGQPYINADHAPVKGKYPVAQWKAGEIIRDEHNIRLPANWPADKAIISVGLWHSGDGARMPVKSGPHDDTSRVTAATIPVHASQAKPVAAPRKRYIARMITKPIKLDGKLDDAAWAAAPSTGPFVNTLTGGAGDFQKTEAKLLWDKKFLYVAFDNTDTDIWTGMNKRDDKLWTQEADELMIDADGNGKTYVELQVAPNGTIFDAYLPEYRKYEDSIDPKRKPYSWNSKMNVKIQVNGTLNKRDDQDKGWTVEMAIPLDDVKGLDKDAAKLPPSPGDVWRINMFRLDTPARKPQEASGWSPPMVGDFHALDRFGELVFADDKGMVPPPAASIAGGPTAGHTAPGAMALKQPAALHGKPPGTDDKKSGGKATGDKGPHEKK
jgi:hypothetical protein